MRAPTKLESFLPRSQSALVFVLAIACYDWAITALLAALVRIMHFPPRPLSFWESHGDPTAHIIEALVFTPLLESGLLFAVIELLRWLRAPAWLQVLLAAVLVAGPHSYTWGWEPYAFVVAPSFAIQSAAYLYWRPVSRKQGFAVIVCIHALHNLLPAMSVIARATSKA
jgi:hypothetical protein